MRMSGRLRTTDIRKAEKSLQDKINKDVSTLIQLIELPDFDVSEFFQTLLKSEKHDEVLDRIPLEKKIDFFARNYSTFLDSQQELLNLKLPELMEIPKAKQFTLQDIKVEKSLQNVEQANVTDIIDSFETNVLEKNAEEVVRIYQIIRQMKSHKKYKKYFYEYNLNRTFTQHYNEFIDSCQDQTILLKIGETIQGIKCYLKKKKQEIISKLQANLSLDSTIHSLNKAMKILIEFIEQELQFIHIKFSEQIKKQEEILVYIAEWISDLTRNFYNTVRQYIYKKEELSQVLKQLDMLLETASCIESKGISLTHDLKILISVDLPQHMKKFIQVVLQALDKVIHSDNQLYQLIYMDSLATFSQESSKLKPIQPKNYSKKCCSRRAIVLINSILLILQPLCNQKWQFLHEGVLTSLIDKIGKVIFLDISFSFWDYYHFYYFFDRLYHGKIKNKKMFDAERRESIKLKIKPLKKISEQCWEKFQRKLTILFWNSILSKIPRLMWNFKAFAQKNQKTPLKPSPFSLELVFLFQQFFKQIQYRLPSQHFTYLVIKFHEYILYTIQYILFAQYHKKGQNQKVFSLYKKQNQLLKKAKQFGIQELSIIKQDKAIMKLSMFSKIGFEKFAFQIYFLTDIYCYLTEVKNIQCQSFISRASQVMAKQTKDKAEDLSKKNFGETLKKMLLIFEKQPQMMRNYLKQKSSIIHK